MKKSNSKLEILSYHLNFSSFNIQIQLYSSISNNWINKEIPLNSYTFDSPFSFKDPKHFYNVIVKILMDPDITFNRKQVILEELLQDYSIEHFTQSLKDAENNSSIVYSDIFFKLVHEYQPKLKKLLLIYINSKEISYKPHHSILKEINIDTIISILFVSILSNCVKEEINQTTLQVEIGKYLRRYHIRKTISDNDLQLTLFKDVENENNEDISLSIGDFLLNLFIETTKMFTKLTEQDDTTKLICSKDLVRLALEYGFMKDTILPMVSEPIAWENGNLGNDQENYSGGYFLNKNLKRFPIIKKSKGNYGNIKVSPFFLEQINRLSAIPFKINLELLTIIEDLFKNKSPMLIHDLHELTDEKCSPEQLKNVQKHNSLFIQQTAIIQMARLMAHVPYFYLPVNADWRGRIYPICSTLSYQGSDLAKSLLLFAEGEQILPENFSILKRYGSNLWENDKLSLEKRNEWFDQNIDKLRNINVEDIIDNDDKFCILAFSIELERWLDKDYTELSLIIKKLHDKEKKVKSITAEMIVQESSNLTFFPIFLDATCNGLQQLGALSRDEKVAKLVNMCGSTPQDNPEDLYSDLIPFIKERILSNPEAPDSLKNLNLSRKLIKRSIMTIPYSATPVGMTEQLIAQMDKIHENNEIFYILKDQPNNKLTRKDIFELANYMYDTFFDTFPQINEIFEYFKKISKAHNKLNSKIIWETPTGLKIEQFYLKKEPIRINCSYRNKKYKITLLKGTDKLNKSRQNLAFIPNFVHSLDATVLFKTVDNFYTLSLQSSGKKKNRNKIFNLITIHDCFATTVGNIYKMEMAVKQSFLEVYQGNKFFYDLISKWENIEKIKLSSKDRPKFGNYDVKEVLKSKYFIN